MPSPSQHGNGEEEHHDAAVHREDLVVDLRIQKRPGGRRKLGTDQHRQNAADGKEHQRRAHEAQPRARCDDGRHMPPPSRRVRPDADQAPGAGPARVAPGWAGWFPRHRSGAASVRAGSGVATSVAPGRTERIIGLLRRWGASGGVSASIPASVASQSCGATTLTSNCMALWSRPQNSAQSPPIRPGASACSRSRLVRPGTASIFCRPVCGHPEGMDHVVAGDKHVHRPTGRQDQQIRGFPPGRPVRGG